MKKAKTLGSYRQRLLVDPVASEVQLVDLATEQAENSLPFTWPVFS